MLRATLKSLLAKKLRLVATAFAIVLGIGFVAGTFVLTDTMNKAFDELFSTATRDVDVVVRAEAAFGTDPTAGGGGGTEERVAIPDDLLEVVAGVAGVKTASGDVAGYAQIVDPKTNEAIGGFGPPTIGSSWTSASTVFQLREGTAPQGPGFVVIDAATAESHGLLVGDEVQILFTGPPEEFRISGIVGFGDADNLAGATIAFFELGTAQRVLGKVGVFDTIQVVAEEGVGTVELARAIGQVLPEDVEAVTSSTIVDESEQAFTEGLGFFKILLLVFAGVALFVGAFIIYNTFSIITAQRTRELGLLRALGASRRQILTSVLVEAAVVGLVASAIGIGAGVLIAMGLKAALSAFNVDLPSTSLQLLPRTIVVSLVVGTLITLVSSIVPARRAAAVPPVEALREGAQAAAGASLHRRILMGGIVTILGVGALAVGLFADTGATPQLIGLGAAVTFVGIAMLAPLVARPVSRWVGAPLSALGVPGKLGRENAMRNPRRTAATASALMIGLGLVVMATILASSMKASFNAALEETLKADLTLTTSSFIEFSPEVAERLRDLPQVGAVTEFRAGQFRVEGQTALLTSIDTTTITETTFVEMLEGSEDALNAPSTMLVHRDIAKDNGWRVGDAVDVTFAATGDASLTIGGIYADDRLLGDYVISNEAYEQHFTEHLDSFVLVKGAEGVPFEQLQRAAERAVADFPNIEVQDQASFREKQAGFIDQLLGLVTVLLAFAVLIALFGIVNTLGLSVFERRREIGLLRAVGMSRRQVRSMIRWESVIIAVLGAGLGTAIGVLFGWALQRALASEGLSELAVPGVQLLIYVVLAGFAGVLAAVLPARRAAKLNVLEAISYE